MKMKSYLGKDIIEGLQLGILSTDELRAIHRATLSVFADYGVMVPDEEARQIFKENGCEVDDKTKMVKIPEHLVNSAIRTAPPRFKLYGREKKDDFVQEAGGEVCWTNFGIGVKMSVYDESKGKYVQRDSTSQDVADSAKLCDWSDNMDFYFQAVEPMELAGVADPIVHAQYHSMVNTSKPFVMATEAKSFDHYIEMQAAYYGGDMEEAIKKPLSAMNGCPTSPLEFGNNVSQLTIKCARLKYPILICSMAMAGASSPVHLAGTLVTHNVEVLTGLVLSQLIEPGAPIWYGSATTVFDLRKGVAPVGCPEMGLISAAVAKMAQFYDLPCFVSGS
jgi:trimethylamine--corrinoid protein Co-methyltransferase